MKAPTARWMIRSVAEAAAGGSRAGHLLSMQPEISRRRVIDPLRVLALLLSLHRSCCRPGDQIGVDSAYQDAADLRVSMLVAVSFHRLIRYPGQRLIY